MDVTFTLGFFAQFLFAAVSFAAAYFAKCAIDERSPRSRHFQFLLLIVGEGGNSRQVRPAQRPAHVRRPDVPEAVPQNRRIDRNTLKKLSRPARLGFISRAAATGTTTMRIFITGANGFIGGAVAAGLIAGGHDVRGLVRDRAKAETVRAHGIEPVIGSLDDSSLLQAEARDADGVVNAANSGHRAAVEALIAGLSGSGKPLVHTSGTSIIADRAMGEPSDRIFYEATPIRPEPERVERVALDRLVLDAAGIRGIVLCNSMIYGHALGAPAQSVQVPVLAQQARSSSVARYIGRGLNRWSNVHIADVASLYALAIMKASSGSFIYVESGEEALGKVVEAIAVKLGLGAPQSWPAEAAIEAWGREKATFSLGSNSRVRSMAATETLGWAPRHRSITEWIARELV
jgi:nucleoside-diphosphate-sugar epimerase